MNVTIRCTVDADDLNAGDERRRLAPVRHAAPSATGALVPVKLRLPKEELLEYWQQALAEAKSFSAWVWDVLRAYRPSPRLSTCLEMIIFACWTRFRAGRRGEPVEHKPDHRPLHHRFMGLRQPLVIPN